MLIEARYGAKIENPCVGGSIPPRATKNSAVQNKTPTHAGWRFFYRQVRGEPSVSASVGSDPFDHLDSRPTARNQRTGQL
jgi:hypothetical protein